MKKHLPLFRHEWLQELKKIAVLFEDKIYTVATSKVCYACVRSICHNLILYVVFAFCFCGTKIYDKSNEFITLMVQNNELMSRFFYVVRHFGT